MLAISWLTWRLTGSATWLGISGFVSQVPGIIFGLIGGAAADRFDRTRALNITQILLMLQAVVLAALTLTGTINIWHVLVLGVVIGIVYSFEFPFRFAFVMDIVGKDDILNANALLSAMFHSTRIIGPVVAGAIVAWKGEGVCFFFNALTFIPLIAALTLVKRGELHYQREDHGPMWDSIKEGIRHLLNDSESKRSMFLVAVISGVGMQFTMLLPMFADQIYRGGSVAMGYVMGAGGVGALSGAAYLIRRKTSEGLLRLSYIMTFCFSLALMAFSLISNLYLAMLSVAAVSFFLAIALSVINTSLQQRTPDHLRGRMMGIFSMSFIGLAPFGGIIVGLIAEWVGAQVTIFSCGVICLVLVGGMVIRNAAQK